jgi:GntR family transcriptional regulator, rspAB operon transcriptional repressor
MLVMIQPPDDDLQGMPPLAPLSEFDGSLAHRVYLTLRRAIMRLDYAPGEMLRKGAICAALGVSRSPVGEAIMRLQAEGLVDVQPQSGSFVARFSMAEIREGAFLREALELAAVESLAGSVTPAHIAALDDSLTRQGQAIAAGDMARFYAEDSRFHETILSATGFRRLAPLSRTAWVHVDRARQLILPQVGRVAQTLDEHRAIRDALAARDAAAARAATRLHLSQLLTYLTPLADTRPDLFTPG